MAGEAELEFELGRDPGIEADPPAETEGEGLAARLKGLENGAGCTKIQSHLSESREG